MNYGEAQAEKSLKKRRYLEFEKPLAELDLQISQLKALPPTGPSHGVDIGREIKALEQKSEQLLRSIFSNLSAYQIVQISRHPDRPSALDYCDLLFDGFVELRGDRKFMEDRSIVGGLASFEGRNLVFLAHQKGRSTQENVSRNFGMPRPEGYRKALRLMQLAERFSLPLLCFIDTPGAYPGIEAEERGQAEAIAENIITMTDLKVPILGVILGEGGSGGALALGVCDRLLMMQYSIYSVISPEGCAAITWKDGSFASTAAERLRLTSQEILKSRVADEIIQEPLGGAHRDPLLAAAYLRKALTNHLQVLCGLETDDLLKQRYNRYREIGNWTEIRG